MRDPLILPLFALVCGILLGRAAGFSRFDAAWPWVVFLVLAALTARRSRWLRRTCVALALLFTGVMAETWHRPGPPPQIDAGMRETVLLEGCVVEPSAFSNDREQFTLELDRGARARVSLALEDERSALENERSALEDERRARDDNRLAQRFEYGQRVEVEARIRPPRNFHNPGSFDYAGYLARQKIFWTATMTRGSQAKVLPGRCGSRAMAAVFALREAALDRIEKLYAGDEYTTGMMEAVLIGETSKLEKIWTVNFRRTGTFHALVISGAHVVVLAGVLMFLLRVCAVPEIPALTVTAGAAWLYALVSGFSPPVARAAAGFTMYLIARFFFRRGRVMNLLAAVAIAYLLWDPGELLDASFQLSFLSVAAIGALAAPLLERACAPLLRGLRGIASIDADPHLEPRVAQFRVEVRLAAETLHFWTRLPLRWMLEPLGWMLRTALFAFEMAVISTVIQIGLALPMAEYFHRISFTGLTANLIIVPLLEAVVPIGFFAIFSGWSWTAAVAGWLLKIAARTADWHARIEPSWRVSDPPLWLALGFTAALIAFSLLVRHRRGRRYSAMAVLALFALLLWQPWPAKITPGTLELTAIDVGQGDSLLVVFPEGRRMVIDGGGVLQFGRRQRKPNLDTGEDVVSPYLWSREIRRIDILVATHAHEDHSGGLAALLENFRPRELWVGANPAPALVERAGQLHIRTVAMHAPASFDFSGARIEVLSPPADYAAKTPGNNDSLAFRIAYGARSFLLTGDMERPMEQRLLDDQRLGYADTLHADVLKVGHHGSKTSTTEPFLEAVSPTVAVISAGYGNSFGHPHRDILARLAERHAAILRTDLDGLVTIRTDGRGLTLDRMSWHESSPGIAFDWAMAAGR
jgi:competence protein ComEC